MALVKKVNKGQDFDRVSPPESVCHKRMGHVNEHSVEKMIRSTKYGMCDGDKLEITKCGVCSETEHTKTPTNGKFTKHAEIKTVHAHIFGSIRTQTLRRKRYFLVMTMPSHRYTWVQFLLEKSDVSEHIHKYIAWI